jgi:hypothetical protein
VPVVWPVAPTVGPDPASRFADVPAVLQGPACAAVAPKTIAVHTARSIRVRFIFPLLWFPPLTDARLRSFWGPAVTTKQEGGRFLGVDGYSPVEGQVGAAPSSIPEMALLSWLKSIQQFIASPQLNGVVFNELLSTFSCSGIIVTDQVDSLQDTIRAYDVSAIFKWWHRSRPLKPHAVVLAGAVFKSGLGISGNSKLA